MTGHRVVLVRPWTDARAGGGCCGGAPRDGIALDLHDHHRTTHDEDPVGRVYRGLRQTLPGLDVQVVDSGNTLWLLPATFQAVRRRAGLGAALSAVASATTAGAVLVDGERVSSVDDGPEAVLAAVASRVGPDRAHS